MIRKFDTSFGGGTSGSSTSSGSNKGIITLIMVVAVGFVAYKFVVKPMLDKRNNENK
jgi:preprotein translocase subunit SecG